MIISLVSIDNKSSSYKINSYCHNSQIDIQIIMTSYLQLLLVALVLAAVRSEWVQQHSNNQQVLAYRRIIKEQNQKRIQEFNSQRTGQTLWPNPEFIHYTDEEIREVFGNKQIRANIVNGIHFDRELRNQPRQKASQVLKNYSDVIVNNSLETGAPKHQGKCGGCYSFAANSLVNYAVNRLYQPVNSSAPASFKLASQQEIIECSLVNVGCDGGWPHLALKYVRMNGVHTDRRYKYRASTYYYGTYQDCEFYLNPQMKANKEMKIGRSVIKASVVNTITSFIAIMNVHKVAAIAIYASDFLFVNHKSGVISNCGEGSIDHAVTLVGYIIDHSTSTYVWIIKNSWGVRWAENGYVRMQMDSESCGPLQYISHLVTL